MRSDFRKERGSRTRAKLLSAVLTLAMVLALATVMGAVAFAEDNPGAGTEPEKIKVPSPLTYKTVIDGVDGEIPQPGQTLTYNQIKSMIVTTGNTAVEGNPYKLTNISLKVNNGGNWDAVSYFKDESGNECLTFEAGKQYRLSGFFFVDKDADVTSYETVGTRHYIYANVNNQAIGRDLAYLDTETLTTDNRYPIYIRFDFTPKTTITSLDYTGFLEPAIGESSWYRKMSKNITDQTHSDITGALDGRGMLYKYKENDFPEAIESEEGKPYKFKYGKYRVHFACVVSDDKYYIDETKPQNITVKVNGVKTNVTEIRTGTPTSPYYVIECWRYMYLDQGPVTDFALKTPGLIYNGEVQLPEVVVKSPLGRELDSSTYTVTPTGEYKDIGTYSIDVGMNDDSGYTGSATLTFKIVPNSTTISLKNTALTYNGKAQLPGVVVKDLLGRVLDSSKYTVTKSTGRKNVGRYSVKVKMNDDSGFTGEKTLYFSINPKGATIKTPSALAKGFTAKWSKQSTKMATSRITGYQIRYSLNSSMTGAKYKKIKGYSNTSKKVTKLKAKKKYYVQVRTYKVVGGKTYYSGWSAKKSVKTK